jgi:hypothetical protein
MNSGMQGQLQSFIREHSHSGVLLDANVLLLLWAYQFDPQLIGGKKLEKYTPEDAVLLANYVSRFHRILTTSSILTEVSNLAGLMLSGKKKAQLFECMYAFFNGAGIDGVRHCTLHGLELPVQTFVQLGYTDASIISVAKTPHFLLTDDLDLYLDAQAQQIPTINFTHMREAAGLL